jgi:hypothetical protein
VHEARTGTQCQSSYFHDSLLNPEFDYGNYQAVGNSKTRLKENNTKNINIRLGAAVAQAV